MMGREERNFVYITAILSSYVLYNLYFTYSHFGTWLHGDLQLIILETHIINIGKF